MDFARTCLSMSLLRDGKRPEERRKKNGGRGQKGLANHAGSFAPPDKRVCQVAATVALTVVEW